MTTTLQFTTILAHQVGELLHQFYSPQGTPTDFKADRSVVTEADLAADRMIAKHLKKNYPNDGLISEETHPAYLLDHENFRNPPEPIGLWVVDPLDGTTNFSLGLHYWGVSIARLVNGWPDIAVLYFPLLDELYTAQKGAGAYLNGDPLQVKPPQESRISFFACCSRTFRRYDVSIQYKARILGCASYTFCTVARGIALLGFESTAKIWDFAGGWLLLQEAGGVMETLDNTQPFPLVPHRDYSQINFPVIAAATADLALKAHDQIRPKTS